MAAWGYWALFFLVGAVALALAKRLDDLDRKRDRARAAQRRASRSSAPPPSDPPEASQT